MNRDSLGLIIQAPAPDVLQRPALKPSFQATIGTNLLSTTARCTQSKNQTSRRRM